MNKQIKEIRQYFRNRYNEIVRYIENSDESRISDVMLLIHNEPHFIDEIALIKDRLNMEQAEAEYQEKVNDKIKPQEYMLDYLNERLTLVNEELARTLNIKAKKRSEIERKNRKTKKINEQIDELQKCKDSTIKLIQELQPTKRKVGRPKKNSEEKKITESVELK